MFGVIYLATEMEGCRFSIGLRNSHDKSMRLAIVCGYRAWRVLETAQAFHFGSTTPPSTLV
jgi:hypothetical protein